MVFYLEKYNEYLSIFVESLADDGTNSSEHGRRAGGGIRLGDVQGGWGIEMSLGSGVTEAWPFGGYSGTWEGDTVRLDLLVSWKILVQCTGSDVQGCGRS